MVLDALRDDLAVTDGRDILNVMSENDLQHLLLKVSVELYRRAAEIAKK